MEQKCLEVQNMSSQLRSMSSQLQSMSSQLQSIKKEPTTFTVIGPHTFILPVQRIQSLTLQIFVCCGQSVTALRPEDVHECGMTRIILV